MQQNLPVTRLQVFFSPEIYGKLCVLGFSLHLVAVGKQRHRWDLAMERLSE